MRIDTNLTALNAFGVSAQVTANNVANVNTHGFQASRARLESGPHDQGVRVASIQKDTSPGVPLPENDPQGQARGASNTDIGHEMVDLMSTQRAYQANATAIRAQDETVGYLLNEMI